MHGLGGTQLVAGQLVAGQSISDKVGCVCWAGRHRASSLPGAPPVTRSPLASPCYLYTLDSLQIVFAGLDIIVPLLSLELLKFPKLCRAYFALLAHMLEVRILLLPL